MSGLLRYAAVLYTLLQFESLLIHAQLVEINLSLIWIGAESLLTLCSSDLKSESLLGDARVLVTGLLRCASSFRAPSRLVEGLKGTLLEKFRGEVFIWISEQPVMGT